MKEKKADIYLESIKSYCDCDMVDWGNYCRLEGEKRGLWETKPKVESCEPSWVVTL